jgi:hypothetical protein
MKLVPSILVGFVFATLSMATASLAQPQENQVSSPRLVETLATVMVLEEVQDGTVVLEQEGNPFEQIRQFIEETKEFLLASYDYNGNGRIDFGDELNDTLEMTKTIVTTLIDQDFDGVIEPEEVRALVDELLATAREQLTMLACDQVNKAAEKAGSWIRFRPILNLLHQRCQQAGY